MKSNRDISKDMAVASTEYNREGEYWLKQLSGEWVKGCFPYDHNHFQREEVESPSKLFPVEFALPEGVFSQLVKLSKGYDYTMHMIFVAMVVALLHKYTGKSDILVGIPIYRQDSDETFINTVLPIRGRIEEGTAFKDLLLQVRQAIIKAEENQNYPMEILLNRLNLPANEFEAGFPLFDTAVLLESIHDKKYLAHICLNTLFSFYRNDRKGGGVLEYSPLFYEKDTAKRIVNRLLKLHNDCLVNIDVKLADIDLMTDEERKHLIFDFNNTAQEYASDKTVVQLFEEQAARTPDRTALVCEEECLTFQELNHRANRLARVLRSKGVGTNDIAAIMEERSLDMIVCILAALKVGAAYMPISSDTPRQRILSILDDARAAIVLAKNRTLEKFLFTSLQGLRSFQIEPTFGPPRPAMKNLEQLQVDRSLVNYEKYNHYIGQCMARNAITIQASRGCPYRCAYCHKIWPKKQVFRSPESILEEVKQNHDLGMQKFAFVDDIFNLDIERSSRFFESVIKAGLNSSVQFFFPNGLRGDLLTREYIDLMAEAGTVSLALALETASPRLQKLLGKNLNLEKFHENIDYLCQKHPQIILELFTMHGFPGESEEEAIMTLEFVKSLRWLHFPYMNVLKIYPNTDMEKIALEHGISRDAIMRSEDFAHYELSDICPFRKSFSFEYRSQFLNDYFLLKERLLHVLPFQMRGLSEDELLQKYNSYLPTDTRINSFAELLDHLKLSRDEVIAEGFAPEDSPQVYQANLEKRKREPFQEAAADAFRVLLLDLSQFFSSESDFFYDVPGVEPLGLMYLLTYLNEHLGTRVNGKIAKARLDFDSYHELRSLVEDFAPDVIGVRSLNIYKDFFHKAISLIRQWGFSGPIIAGGPYATSDPATVLQDRNIDLVVLGEGEVTFYELILAIIENRDKLPGEDDLMTIPGIAFIPTGRGSQTRFHREVIMVDELTGMLSRYPAGNLEPVSQPQDLVYVIFTSGSTGRPKGVMIEHRSLNNLVAALKRCIYQEYGETLKVAQVAPFVFDASVKQIFAVLVQGHTLHIVPDETRMDSGLLLDFFARYQIDVSDATPAHIKFMQETIHQHKSDTGFKASSSLKHLIVGGEPLPVETVEKFLDGCCGASPRITNIYGLTECTVDSTSYQISKANVAYHHRHDTFPIGKAMANTAIYILDSQNRVQPLGIAGELCIAGVGVGRGYLNNPELTAEKFTYMSYRTNESNIPRKLYKTGDLARWLPGGNIEFLGRLDHQVKIRGYRIEAGEIESRLRRHEKIKDALVLAKSDRSGDKYLCAYIVPDPPDSSPTDPSLPSLNPSDLREYLLQYLPAYMVPTYFVPLAAIPLNRNGKVDRNSLPEPQLAIGERDIHGYAPAGDELEKRLVGLWADLFGIEPDELSIDADFFELGGHSLKATILIARIHKALDIKIPLAEMFRTPTIRGMAKFIRRTREREYTPIPAVEKKEYYPLSPAMRRLYFEQQLNPGDTNYNITAAAWLEGDLDPRRLEGIFTRLIHRHETLRTAFEVAADDPVQRVLEPGKVEFVVEYTVLSPSERSAKNGSLRQEVSCITNNFVRAFDISRAPLFRVGLIKTGEQEHVLIVDMHHMVADGTSLGILMKEFMALYNNESLPELKCRYRDFSVWKSDSRQNQGEPMEKQKRYWFDRFRDEIPLLNLPCDYPRPQVKSNEGRILLGETLGEPETQGLRDLALREDVTPYMLTLALFNVLLMKLSGQEDIVVGTPLAGRNHADLESLIGMFVNTLALRSYPTGNKTFGAFLKEVKEQTILAFVNQDFGFEDLVKQVGQRDISRSPLFDVFFALQNMEIPDMVIPGLRLRPYEFERKVSRLDMSFQVYETGPRLSFLVEYCTRLFEEETIRMFINNYREVIAAVLDNPDIPLKDIEISTDVLTARTTVPQMDLGF